MTDPRAVDSRASDRRVADPRIAVPRGADPRAAGSPDALRLEEVSIALGGRTILDEISFSLGPGEVTGLIGSNGAGKTTLLRIVMGLLRPDRGTVLIGGSPAGRHRQVGYVPQKVLVEPDTPLRPRDLVALGLDGHRLGPRFPSRGRREKVEAMLDSVGALAFADERVGTLSGGELQRVLIAHALIGQPTLLLLDEPLANLDLRSGQEIVELIDRVAREHRVCVLLSAHDMNPLLSVMHKVVYLVDGRAASGSVAEVVRSEVLSELYRHPVSVLSVDGRVLVVAGSSVTTGVADQPVRVP